jgi:prepilin-type N-terminal cleavage/methylation domain-containing protein
MPGGKHKKPLGYTIVEVMVVLAVSGVMFLMAVDFINGRQEGASFTNAINSMASDIQDAEEQVQDGRYSDIPINCNGTSTPITISSGSGSQGSNNECVFVGKLIHFYGGLPDSINNIQVFTLADTINPSSGATGKLPDHTTSAVKYLTTTEPTPEGIYIYKGPTMFTPGMYVSIPSGGAGSTTSYNIGFAQTQGNYQSVTQNYQTGAQSTYLVYDPNLTNSQVPIGSEASVAGNVVQQAQGAKICFTDGTRFAEIKFGGEINYDYYNPLTINIKWYGNTPC